ncbi:MAG: hypothetical protein QF768_08635 [Candidatus Latescibacteria bacterium]|nr:hypothetical protein [Candidatus Latescibacterota bacterium]
MRFATRHLSGLAVSILVVVHAVAEIEPEFQKGITFTHGYRGGNNMRSGASAGSLRHLRQRLSVEWIAVNPFGYQTSVHTIGIRFGGDPRDEHLIDGIRQAQQLGLKVMLKPLTSGGVNRMVAIGAARSASTPNGNGRSGPLTMNASSFTMRRSPPRPKRRFCASV